METTFYKDIFVYIESQEGAYKLPIMLYQNWSWNMPLHIRTSSLYKHSQLLTGKDDYTPVKNITRPILNLQYRSEGFDVKNIEHYVSAPELYYKSFLVKKFYEKWANDNNLDTTIDSMVESYIDYGGALLKNVNSVKPEVVPLESIVFCDQTDILSGPIGIKHYFSPDQLLDMADKGWGDEKNGATATLEQAIVLSREQKKNDTTTTVSQTPGKYVEVYEVHGNFPESFLTEGGSNEKYSSQFHIVCFYQTEDGNKGNITLFKAEEPESPFKFIARDPIYGRALGFGGAEELFEPQVWTNYIEKRMLDSLDAASKTVFKGIGEMKSKYPNGLRDVDNLEIIDLNTGEELEVLDTRPRAQDLFKNKGDDWLLHGRSMGAAQEAISGDQAPSGTPFASLELQARESHSLHEYRQGKLATFWCEVEREWILPKIAKEITKDQTFLAELDLEELQHVSDALVTSQTNDYIKEKILSGETIEAQEVETYKQQVRDDFKKKGNKHFIEIFKDEMKDIPIEVQTNVAGKQKNLAQMVDKLSNLAKFVFSTYNPQTGSFAALDDPRIAKWINQINEYSGLEPMDFTPPVKPPMVQTADQTAKPSPLQVATPQNAQ